MSFTNIIKILATFGSLNVICFNNVYSQRMNTYAISMVIFAVVVTDPDLKRTTFHKVLTVTALLSIKCIARTMGKLYTFHAKL